MKREELKEGICYMALHNGDHYIFVAKGDNRSVPYLYLQDGKIDGNISNAAIQFSIGGCLVGPSFPDYDEATYEEAEYLEQCNQLGKCVPYVPKARLYEIY